MGPLLARPIVQTLLMYAPTQLRRRHNITTVTVADNMDVARGRLLRQQILTDQTAPLMRVGPSMVAVLMEPPVEPTCPGQHVRDTGAAPSTDAARAPLTRRVLLGKTALLTHAVLNMVAVAMGQHREPIYQGRIVPGTRVCRFMVAAQTV